MVRYGSIGAAAPLSTRLGYAMVLLAEGARVGIAASLQFWSRVMKQRRGHAKGATALRLSEQSFHAIWDAAADAMALSDAEGIVLAANPSYYQLYGYAPDQVLGNSFAIIFPEDQRAWAVEQYTALFQSRLDIPVYESTIRRADGSERIVETHATFTTLDGTQPALLSIIRDITARKRLEAERDDLLTREHAARLEAETALSIRDQFLAVAAHELKTPLTSLRGYTQVLRRRASREQTLSERDQRALQVIDAQAKRLHGLVDSLLDIGRIQAGGFSIERKPLDLCSLVRQLVEESQPTLEQHTIQLGCQADALIVAGDAGRLEQVVQNLLQNALKYSPSGGLVTVRVYGQDGRACLEVSDHGIGIPEAAQAHLFQPFYRATNVEEGQIQGMGIGLYVVKEIVARHGGEITVLSREGVGSTFTVFLPLHTANPSG
jgi:PAS domain S-box-containing protein